MTAFKASDKVWIYTSKDPLTSEGKEKILSRAEEFLSTWESHGAKVKGEIGIAYDRFVIIVADDCGGDMCGRAQDAQIRFIKEIGEELNLDLTDRMQLAYKSNSYPEEILVKALPAFKQAMQAGKITPDTIVFNNMVTTFGEFNTNWEVPLKDSWHRQLI